MDKKKLIRWIILLPSAFIMSVVVTPVVLHLVLYSSLTGSGFITPYPELPEILLSPSFIALVFIATVYWVSPSHKMITTAIATSIYVIAILTVMGLAYFEVRIADFQYTLPYKGMSSILAIIASISAFCLLRLDNSKNKPGAESPGIS